MIGLRTEKWFLGAITLKGSEGVQVRERGAPRAPGKGSVPPVGVSLGRMAPLRRPISCQSALRGHNTKVVQGEWGEPGGRDVSGVSQGAGRPPPGRATPWGGLGLLAPARGANTPKFLDRGCGSLEPSHKICTRASQEGQGRGRTSQGARPFTLRQAGPAGPFVSQSSSWLIEAITQGKQGRARG